LSPQMYEPESDGQEFLAWHPERWASTGEAEIRETNKTRRKSLISANSIGLV
jgi:hypothetical protein